MTLVRPPTNPRTGKVLLRLDQTNITLSLKSNYPRLNVPILFDVLPHEDTKVEHTRTIDCHSWRAYGDRPSPLTEGCGWHGSLLSATFHQVFLLVGRDS